MSRSVVNHAAVSLLILGLVACGGNDDPEDPDPGASVAEEARPDGGAAAGVVRITAPADGASVAEGPVTVRFEVEGLRIVPAGTMDLGTGHHHLVVDTTLASWADPIPAMPGRFIHLGQGQSEFVLDGLSPGDHTVIAIVADGVHIPLDPPVADTVTFTVGSSVP